MCLLKYVLNCEVHFSYLDPDYPTSRLTVTGLARVYCTSNLFPFALMKNYYIPVFSCYKTAIFR
jgi:hypothetical protein